MHMTFPAQLMEESYSSLLKCYTGVNFEEYYLGSLNSDREDKNV